MDVMDGRADNSSPLIKPPSYRYDLRSKGLKDEVCSLGGDRHRPVGGLRRFGEASLGRKPDR
jgi:hypothetical protein